MSSVYEELREAFYKGREAYNNSFRIGYEADCYDHRDNDSDYDDDDADCFYD